MCGIVGFTNLKQNLENDNYKNILNKMTDKIQRRGPDEEGYFYSKHCMLGHKRLVVVDKDGGKQPMTCSLNNNTYTLVYNGQLYNTRELIKIAVLKNCFDDPKEIAAMIAERTHSQVVHVIGKKIVLYKESKDNKKIELPK